MYSRSLVTPVLPPFGPSGKPCQTLICTQVRRLKVVPVFIISLEHRPRCGALRATLAQLGIPFEMIPAVDVRDLDAVALAALYDEHRALRRLGRAMGRAEIGCALSHRIVYGMMLDRAIPLALVLEEDAIPGPQFKSFWQESGTLPAHIEVLSLYAEAGFVRRRRAGSFGGCGLHEATLMLTNTVGYIIRQSCARAMIRSNTPVSIVADWPLDGRSMRQFLALPMPVGHNNADSLIAGERPVENVLRRYRSPRWFSALFHLSYMGYVMQPGRYEGPVNYYRREVARRIRELISPRQINVRTCRAPSVERQRRGTTSCVSRSFGRVRRIAYWIGDAASGRGPLWSVLRSDGAMSRSCTRTAKLKIGCYANWPDFDDALRLLTPNASRVWQDVAFVPAGSIKTDWVGIFNQPKERVVEFIGSPDRVFFAIGEPPTAMHRPLHLGQGHGTTVFTCDQDLVAARGATRHYVLTPPMLRTWSVRRSFDQLRAAPICEKTRRLSWITSNVDAMAGHRRRLEFLKRLQNGLTFDLYGRGFRRVYDKWDALAPYRYSIAFENTCAPYYFTEKLMDCYVCETMPIYVGDPHITNFFPRESLMVIDPGAPDVIEQIRAIVASNAWLSNRDAILEAKRRVLNEYNVFAMLSRLIAAGTAPCGPAVRMRFSPVRLNSRDDAGAA